MIKTVRLTQFKAFEDTGPLEIKPITVLAGPNSGGKSSLLQSLLLLKQTLAGPPETPLNLDGQYLQFSAFNELAFGRPSLAKSAITYHFGVETPMPRDVVPRYFPDATPAEHTDTVSLDSNVDFTFRYKRGQQGGSVIVDRFRIDSQIGSIKGPAFRTAYKAGIYKPTLTGKGVRRRPKTLATKRIETVHGRHFLPHYLVFEGATTSDYRQHLALDPIFLNPLYELREEIDDNLVYLGPLRQRPQRAYLHSGNPTIDIGDSGEYAAQILWLEKDDPITYIPALDQEPREVTLLEAVNDAFFQIGMLQPLNVKSEKSIMYQILFPLEGSNSNESTTIADVGFGVSQLLPILVLGLRLHKSSLLLLEQPEIHLHPRLQANLADFLLTLSAQGRRIVVETHSDHFINRLRRRIAEDPSGDLQDTINILFVHPPAQGRGATIEPLKIDPYGVIENWPPEFLPEASDEAEAIFLAGINKRGM